MCTCAATREARSSADNWCLVLLLLGAHGAAAATARPPTEDQLATVRSGVASGGPIEYGNQILDVAVAVTGVPSHLAAPHWAVGGPGGSSSASALPAVANGGQPLRSYDSVNLLKFLSKKPQAASRQVNLKHSHVSHLLNEGATTALCAAAGPEALFYACTAEGVLHYVPPGADCYLPPSSELPEVCGTGKSRDVLRLVLRRPGLVALLSGAVSELKDQVAPASPAPAGSGGTYRSARKGQARAKLAAWPAATWSHYQSGVARTERERARERGPCWSRPRS